jgi:hypothetical protein
MKNIDLTGGFIFIIAHGAGKYLLGNPIKE